MPTDKDYTGLVLNEVCGGENDSKDDYVELKNTSSVAIDLGGVRIVKTDEDGISEIVYTYPTSASLAAGAYSVVDNTMLSASISNSKDVAITVEMPSGTVIDTFDKVSDIGSGNHEIGGSYSRLPDGTGDWTVTNVATRGTANEASSQPEQPSDVDYSVLRLNELNGNDPKYIELYNTSTEAIDITGVSLRKDAEKIVYVAPKGTTIEGHGFLVLLSDQEDYSTGFTSGLSAKKSVMIELLQPDETLIDVFKNLSQEKGEKWGENDPLYNGDETGMAYARDKDGTGDWYMMDATQGSSNANAVNKGDKIEWGEV